MPPGPAHYRGQNSNPFNNYAPTQFAHQSSHFQHQNNFQSHGLGNGPYSGTHQNGNANPFGTGLGNGGLGNNFGSVGGLGGGGPTSLASHEVQMRFAQGGAIQPPQQDVTSNVMTRGGQMQTRIREVWKGNLKEELDMIRSLIDQYPYVSMDTEFPGVVARPMGNFPSKADYHYQCLRCNVDLLKIIQLGITLFSVEGDLPPSVPENSMARNTYANNLIACPCTWTFNFKFSLDDDMYSDDSINMLKRSGVDFERNKEIGIDPKEFGSRLIDSGLVLFDHVTWLSFHSGYDYGYLVKIMSQQQLPEHQDDYLKLVRKFFPRIYDIKYLFRHAQRLAVRGLLSSSASNIISNVGQRSGLQDIADELGCHREGRPHTAGSDAWLTGLVFWQLRQKLFDGNISEEHEGMIWGLTGVGSPAGAGGSASNQTPNTNGATLYTGMTPSSYKPDVPSTPQTSHPGLNTTPGPHGGYPGGGMAGLTSGGVFSSFGQQLYHSSKTPPFTPHEGDDKEEKQHQEQTSLSNRQATHVSQNASEAPLQDSVLSHDQEPKLRDAAGRLSTPLDPMATSFHPPGISASAEQNDTSQFSEEIQSLIGGGPRSKSPCSPPLSQIVIPKRNKSTLILETSTDADAGAVPGDGQAIVPPSNLDGAMDYGDALVDLFNTEANPAAASTAPTEQIAQSRSTESQRRRHNREISASTAAPENLQSEPSVPGVNTARQGRRTRREKRRRRQQQAMTQDDGGTIDEATEASDTAKEPDGDVDDETIPEGGTVRINYSARLSRMAAWFWERTGWQNDE